MGFPYWLQWVATSLVADYPTEVLVTVLALPWFIELIYFVVTALVYRHEFRAVFVWVNFRMDLPLVTITAAKRRLVVEPVDTFWMIHDRVGYHIASYLVVAVLAGGIATAFCLLELLLAGVTVGVVLFATAYALVTWRKVRNYITTSGFKTKLHAAVSALMVTAVAGGTAASLYWLNGQFGELLHGGEWPQLTAPKAALLLGYSTVTAIHYTKTVLRLNTSKAKLPDALFHLCMGGLGTLITVLHAQTGIDRYHHDFLGLLIAVLPLTSAKCIGVFYVVDSMLYIVVPYRIFGFADLVMQQLGWIIGGAVSACAPQLWNIVFLALAKTRRQYARPGGYTQIQNV